MSSNNRLNALPNNVKIKIEPGTIAGTSRLTNMLQDTVNIKIEPGTSQRLTSLKLPRDLKLGGSKSKVFKPNLNVTRNKRSDAGNSPSPQQQRGRGRGRGRGSDRGRGAPRGRPSNTVQSYGVFSEGIVDAGLKKTQQYSDRLREDKDYDPTKVMDKPTINKNIEWKVDKNHEDAILNDLLGVHLEPDDEDMENDLNPVTLPISKGIESKPIVKLETVFKCEEKSLENGVSEKKVFESNEKLLLFQFPDTLPGIGPTVEPEVKPNSSASNTNTDNSVSDPEKPQTATKCTLQDINEGLLGKILIYKSGKTKMVIGNTRFDIEMAPDSGFLQDVMSVPVNTATKTGDMINLGSLGGNIIVTPEWDNLLQLD